jgi:flagellar hook-associated protein 3 FlgL
MRISSNTTKFDSLNRINAQQSRLNILQERLATGKKINRASDDPAGAEAVLNLRTSQTEIKQFERAAGAVSQKLVAGDDALNTYQNILDTVRTNLAKGLTDTNSQVGRDSLAVELEAMKSRILSIANTKNGEEFVFGGTNQTAPPYDSSATPSASSSVAQYVQIEPGANAIPTGVTAESVFADSTSDIFKDLDNAISALRGTGDAADKATLQTTMTRMSVYTNQAAVARATIGANMNIAEAAQDALGNSSLSLSDRINDIEGDDFASTALQYADAQKALDATLQVAAKGSRSLFDYI